MVGRHTPFHALPTIARPYHCVCSAVPSRVLAGTVPGRTIVGSAWKGVWRPTMSLPYCCQTVSLPVPRQTSPDVSLSAPRLATIVRNAAPGFILAGPVRTVPLYAARCPRVAQPCMGRERRTLMSCTHVLASAAPGYHCMRRGAEFYPCWSVLYYCR